jgi:glyoxylase-like metal-dependent hydrolase (beta-lactamase superfamily II)
LLALLFVTFFAAVAHANEVQPGELEDCGWEQYEPKNNLHCMHVRGNVYMLVGGGSNITVQVGQRFVIVVDTGLPKYTDELIATIRRLTKLPVLFIVNTSSDLDHIGGNTKLSREGWALPNAALGQNMEEEKDPSRLKMPTGAPIVVSDNTMNTTSDPTGKMSAIAFGKEGFKLYSKEPVFFFNMPKAHIDGDTLVLFRTSDVISAGDVFSTVGYPVIDQARGGSIDGELDAVNSLIELMVPREYEEGGTYVIPGHGRLSDRNDVVNYRDMLTIIRDRVRDMVKNGMTLEQVKAAKPTLDYDGRYGSDSGPWTTSMFIEAIYRDMANEKNPQEKK